MVPDVPFLRSLFGHPVVVYQYLAVADRPRSVLYICGEGWILKATLLHNISHISKKCCFPMTTLPFRNSTNTFFPNIAFLFTKPQVDSNLQQEALCLCRVVRGDTRTMGCFPLHMSFTWLYKDFRTLRSYTWFQDTSSHWEPSQTGCSPQLWHLRAKASGKRRRRNLSSCKSRIQKYFWFIIKL